jgi:acetyl esterase/lipase
MPNRVQWRTPAAVASGLLLLIVAASMAAAPKGSGPAPKTDPANPKAAPAATKGTPVATKSEMRPDGTQVFHNLEYVPGGHERQKLDLYIPTGTRAKSSSSSSSSSSSAPQQKWPLIVYVHGGAFMMGDKSECGGALMWLREGYAIASINYRFSQHALFPAQIEDCKSAVRWLRTHAAAYGLDPDHIGAFGESAGGHLVALLGAAGGVKEFETGENLDVSSRVQAVCDWYGPTDFTVILNFPSAMNHAAPDSPEARLLGGRLADNLDKARRASPITYVAKDTAPFLIIHGDKDDQVPFNQSEIFTDALKKAGVPVTFYPIAGAGHGGPQYYTPATVAVMRDFFAKYLKPAAPAARATPTGTRL